MRICTYNEAVGFLPNPQTKILPNLKIDHPNQNIFVPIIIDEQLMLRVFYQTPTTTMTIRTKAVRACPHCQHDMECVGITRPI